MRGVQIRRGLAAVAFAALLASPGMAQDQELRDDIEALKKGQDEIRKQLADILAQLKSRPAAPARRAGANVEDKIFDVSGNPAKGADTAKLTLVDITDYQ